MIVYIYIGFWVISFDDCYKTLDFFVLSFNFINDNKYSCTVHLDLYMQIYNSVQAKHQQMCNKCYTKRTTNGAGTSYFWGAPVFSPAFGQVFQFVYCVVARCLSFSPFSLGHCIICPSSIYGFWSLFWYLKSFRKRLKMLYIIFTILWLCKRKLKMIANSCTIYVCYKV